MVAELAQVGRRHGVLRGDGIMPGVGGYAKLNSSHMRHRVVIQRIASETQDANHQPIKTYATRYAAEPAAFEQVSGGEFLRGRQVDATVKAIFTVNYRPDYSTRDRVVFDGEIYGIVRLHIPRGVKRFLEIECAAAGQ